MIRLWFNILACIFALAIGLRFPISSVLAGTYSVEDLGLLIDLPGRTDSTPNDINNRGQVAAANVANGAYQAFVIGAAWTNIGTLGGSECLGSGINESVQVVGSSLTPSGSTHAFLWTPGATNGYSGNPQMKDLGTLGGTESAAYAINAVGQITGFARTTQNDNHVFLYSAGKMTDLGIPSVRVYLNPTAIP